MENHPVPHLHRLWSRSISVSPADAREWAADRAVIYGLGLGLQETLHFLHAERPDFAGFEQWVAACHGGLIPAERIAAANEAVRRAFTGEKTPLPADFEPVLSAEEMHSWDENGYLVLRDAAKPKDCVSAAEAIWSFLGMEPDRPDSWYGDTEMQGIMVPLIRHPAFEANRQSGRIRRAFAQLWGTEDLCVTADQGGFNPPERPGQPFRGQGLHWDTSLVPPVPLGVQGILYLADTPAEQGAFRCVPGFHRRIERWLADLPAKADPRQQDLSSAAVKVPGNAGDMVLWHSSLPHGASPNRGAWPRLVQYITYFPPGLADERPWR